MVTSVLIGRMVSGIGAKLSALNRKKFPSAAWCLPHNGRENMAVTKNYSNPIQDATVSPMTNFCVFSETPAFLSFIS